MIMALDRKEGIAVLRPSGRLTIGPNLDEYRETVRDLVGDGERHLTVDLTDVSFLDSAALGEIVASRRALTDVGGRLVLAGARGKVRDLLALTRIGELIETYDDLDAAVRSFSTSGLSG